MKKLVLFSVVLVSLQSFSQTVDDVIGKYITAMGGLEKIHSLKSLYIEQVAVMQNGNEVNSKIWKVQDKLMRREINFGMGSATMIVTDKAGWASNPRSGGNFEPMNPEVLKAQQTELECVSPLVDYAAKGSKAELQGEEDVDGKKCYKVKLTTAGAREITYFIDETTYYIDRTSMKGGMGRRPGADPNAETKIDYSDYRKTPEGFVFPYTTTIVGMGASSNIEKIEVNPTLDLAKLSTPSNS
ncbi:MAG: hypothetical protein C5B52_06750 [Bacteroidetes bacterium]|nr:MAG: hypothetical protein C5B52_06750 [Bacteroidota bacterium]